MLAALAGGTGCAVHMAPPEVGTNLDPKSTASVLDSVRTADAMWKLLLTTSPTGSWGGEGLHGYHLVRTAKDSTRVETLINLGEWMDQRLGNISADHEFVWVGLSGGGLIQVSTTKNRIVDVIQVAEVPEWWRSEIPWTEAIGNAVWVLVPGRGELYRVLPQNRDIEAIPLNGGLGYYTGLTSDLKAVFVTCLRGNYRVDLETGAVTVEKREKKK
jgi:hypothetical protein